MEAPHKSEIPGPDGSLMEGFPLNKRGSFRGRGGPLRGGPPRGRGGISAYPGRGGPSIRGLMIGRSGPPGRGALRLVAPGAFMHSGRGGLPIRSRTDIAPMRGDGRGGMFRGRVGRNGPSGRVGPPGGAPRSFGGPPRPSGPLRGPPGGPSLRGGINRPLRAAPPQQTQPVVLPMGGLPERFPPPGAGGAIPKRGPSQAGGPPQGTGSAGLIKKPRYDAPGYSNGYPTSQSSFSNPSQLDNYPTQGVSYSSGSSYGSGSHYPSSYNNYSPNSGGTYQSGSGNYSSNYSTQLGYESTPDYPHSTYAAGGSDERYPNQYSGQEYSSYNKPTNPDSYNFGGPGTYSAPSGGYDERTYGGAGGIGYEGNQVYGANPGNYGAKPEYVYYQ